MKDRVSNMPRILNMLELLRVLDMPEYVRIVPGYV